MSRPLSPIERMIDAVTGHDPSKVSQKTREDRQTEAVVELIDAAIDWRKRKRNIRSSEIRLAKAAEAVTAIYEGKDT